MYEIEATHPLRRMFAGMVENALMAEVGICAPDVTDYVSDVLVEFVHVDRIFRLRDINGETIREISRMQAETYLRDETGAARTRLIHKYIGDFTLFWAGVYPESLRPRHQGVDRLHEYLLEGKRAYGIAGELTRTTDRPPASVLQQMSEQFEYCVHGLHLVRAGWESLSRQPRPN